MAVVVDSEGFQIECGVLGELYWDVWASYYKGVAVAEFDLENAGIWDAEALAKATADQRAVCFSGLIVAVGCGHVSRCGVHGYRCPVGGFDLYGAGREWIVAVDLVDLGEVDGVYYHGFFCLWCFWANYYLPLLVLLDFLDCSCDDGVLYADALG